MVGGEPAHRSGQAVGPYQQHPVLRGDGAEVIEGAAAGQVDERGLAVGAGGVHPGRGFQDQDVIAAPVGGAPEHRLGDGQQQQGDGDELQQQRERLLDLLAPGEDRSLGELRKKPQRGDHLAAAGTIIEKQGHHGGADRYQDGQELDQGEVEKIHPRIPAPAGARREPKMASSTGTSVTRGT